MRRRVVSALVLAAGLSALCPVAASAGPTDCAPAIAPHPVAGACQVLVRSDSILGTVGTIVTAPISIAKGAAGAVAGLGLSAIVSWVLGGAGSALHETASLIGKTTTPQLGDAWFSTTYLRMGAIATLLTLPFLCAAAVQSLLHSDLAMLARATLGYLPLAMLAIGIAVPLTSLLLAASDSISSIIDSAAGNAGAAFLTKTSVFLGGISAIDGSPFIAFLVGFFVAAGALMLWVELVLREVAVYVIVLMLPLVFAALVWPARRIWAVRALEMLVALILAKVAIVAILALGAGALDHASSSFSIVSLLAGVALVTLGLFAPWALVKLMPVGELAAAAAGPLRGQLQSGWQTGAGIAIPWGGAGEEVARDVVDGMRRMATGGDGAPDDGPSDPFSRGAGRETDGVEGVTGDGGQDPHPGTADPPDGPLGGGGGPAGGGGAPGGGAGAAAPGEGGAGAPAIPARGPAGPPADPAEGPGAPAAPTPPPDPAEGASELHQTSRAERGPSPKFEGFGAPEPIWQAEDETWEEDWLGEAMRPPAQDPEDGRL